MTAATRAPTLLLAVALDAALREPPARCHPVVALGWAVDRLEARLPAPGAPGARAAGVAAAAVLAGTSVAAGAVAERLPWPLRAAVLWGLLSGRLLLDEVAAVESALARGGAPAGRTRVARLVSRPTDALDAAGVRAAAIGTLAENTADAVVATLWWWAVAGLPGAALHRSMDVLDSRWGYRDARWARRGWGAARADDLLALVPARLTALLWRGRLDGALRAEAGRTPSPNGGWPMGAAALAAGCRLEKRGAYVLHPAGREPDAAAVAGALVDARRVMLAAVALACGAAVLRDAAAARAGAT